jgi:uncharacterized protein (TIGR00369 family)
MDQAAEPDIQELLSRRSRAAAGGLLGRELLEIDAEAGWARVAFLAQDRFLNPFGMVQGGFLVAMLDEVMVDAALAKLGADFVVPTLEIKASFLRPAPAGRILGEGRVLRRGRAIIFTEGRLQTPDGEAVATASATAVVRAHPGGAGLTGD